MTIADRIIRLREDNGLSQEDFAQKLGVSPSTVADWESGNSMPTLDDLTAMRDTFSASTYYLLTGNFPPKFEPVSLEEAGITDIEPVTEKSTQQSTDNPEDRPKQKHRHRQKRHIEEPSRQTKIKALAVLLAACLIFGAIIPLPLGGYKRLWAKLHADPNACPYILVHGLAGWGESSGISSVSSYWGYSAGSITDYLRGEGIKVYEASVGPFSSAWDRACELYAQLTGTTVDYGAAHSAEHGHNRYGITYKESICKEWEEETKNGQPRKINLIGHSFGGNTIRLFASLMEYGNEAEIQASPNDCSPLFKGGKGNRINSVTTIASPHNGSTLYYLIDQQNLIPTALALAQTAGGITDIFASGVINFQLEHFGIISNSKEALEVINGSFMTGKDNASYDLSLHGAAKLNETIKTVDSIYYFSYSYCTTEKAKNSDNHNPTISTGVLFMPFAKLIGSYTDTSDSAPVKIDESWLPNDGAVNVISALYPFDEEAVNYTQGDKIRPGIWYVFPTKRGDHGTPIGMSGSASEMRKFYLELVTMIDELSYDS